MPIRIRLSLAFTVVAALLVAVGAWLFVSRVSSTLLGSLDTQLATAAGLADRHTTAVTSGEHAAGAALPGEYLLQLVDATGRVAAASADAGASPLVTGPTLEAARRHRVEVDGVVDDEQHRIVAEPYRGHPGWVAAAAVSLEDYDRSMHDVIVGAVVGGLLAVLAAAVGSFVLGGRALAPVERLRREVAAQSERHGATALAVPPTRDELAALARTMNDLLGRLHAALDRQRGFVADASHELRTPLAVLSAELELAGRPGRSRDELDLALSSAAEEVARLERLTEDLLLLARSDNDRLDLRVDDVDVTGILRRSATAAAGRAAAAQLTIDVDAPDRLPARVDADRLRQAVDNLLDNALPVAPRGTSVELRAGRAGTSLVLEVLDRGPGFPPDFLPVAFERFRRPAAGRDRSEGGAGLGLSIVAAIAAAHHGTATARNRSGGGAAVRIDIPPAAGGEPTGP